MPYDPAEHHRRSIRLLDFDYTHHGAYFITLCSDRRACLFGTIRDAQMLPSQMGRIVEQCWRSIPDHYPSVELDEFIVMPNHLHGILWLMDDDHAAPRKRASLGAVVGSFKSAATREINARAGLQGALVWQRNYFEHVIRKDEALATIREYIQTNPSRWHQDVENAIGDGSDDVKVWLERLNGKSRSAALPHPSPIEDPVDIHRGRGMPRPYTDKGRQ